MSDDEPDGPVAEQLEPLTVMALQSVTSTSS